MRLLLVEDDSRVARFIRKGLEAENYQVDVASDGDLGMSPRTAISASTWGRPTSMAPFSSM